MSLPPSLAPKQDGNIALLRDVNYVVTTAKEIRGMSDMQGALELLRLAAEGAQDELTPGIAFYGHACLRVVGKAPLLELGA